MHKPFDRVAAEQRVPLDMIRAEVCKNMAPSTPFSQPSVALPDQIADQSQYTTARQSRNQKEASGKAKSCRPAQKRVSRPTFPARPGGLARLVEALLGRIATVSVQGR